MTIRSSAKPLVSIVTPVLNRVSSIEQCLRSVATQTYPYLEHILVDGGSTDGTLDVIKAIESPHKRTLISEPDEGMYDAINKGLRIAKGEILAYLNSDDLYMPWSVQVAVDGLAAAEADLVFGDLGVLLMGDPPGFFPQFYPPFDLNYYTHFATLGQPTVFWRHDLLSEIGLFDTTYSLIGDCEFWLRAARAGASLSHIDEILAIQVEHDDTLRAKHPDLLSQEFARLRSDLTEVAGPARRRWRHGLRRRARWRQMQLQFLSQADKAVATKWPHFIGFLQGHSVSVRRRGLLWYLLPGPLRPADAAILDVEAFQAVLMRDMSGSG